MLKQLYPLVGRLFSILALTRHSSSIRSQFPVDGVLGDHALPWAQGILYGLYLAQNSERGAAVKKKKLTHILM